MRRRRISMFWGSNGSYHPIGNPCSYHDIRYQQTQVHVRNTNGWYGLSDVDRVWDCHLNARALVAFDNAIEDLSDSYHNIFDTNISWHDCHDSWDYFLKLSESYWAIQVTCSETLEGLSAEKWAGSLKHLRLWILRSSFKELLCGEIWWGLLRIGKVLWVRWLQILHWGDLHGEDMI